MTLPMKPVTLRRWEVVTAFLFNVVAIVVVALVLSGQAGSTHHLARRADTLAHENQRVLVAIQRDKASIRQLETTNCRLREFLISSAALRKRVAEAETSPTRRRADIKAAKVSSNLARDLANDLCPA